MTDTKTVDLKIYFMLFTIFFGYEEIKNTNILMTNVTIYVLVIQVGCSAN